MRSMRFIGANLSYKLKIYLGVVILQQSGSDLPEAKKPQEEGHFYDT